jgi:hypothetical protein
VNHHQIVTTLIHLSNRAEDHINITCAKAEVSAMREAVLAIEDQAATIGRLEAELAAARAQLPPQHWNAVYNTDALNRACAELPEGWEIKIGLEKDAGWIDLYTPTGEQIDLVNSADTIYWMVHAAIDHARQAEAQGEKK